MHAYTQHAWPGSSSPGKVGLLLPQMIAPQPAAAEHEHQLSRIQQRSVACR